MGSQVKGTVSSLLLVALASTGGTPNRIVRTAPSDRSPDGAATIVRHGQAMSMNNSGEERIEVVSPIAAVVDEINYDGAADGQVINHPTP